MLYNELFAIVCSYTIAKLEKVHKQVYNYEKIESLNISSTKLK